MELFFFSSCQACLTGNAAYKSSDSLYHQSQGNRNSGKWVNKEKRKITKWPGYIVPWQYCIRYTYFDIKSIQTNTPKKTHLAACPYHSHLHSHQFLEVESEKQGLMIENLIHISLTNLFTISHLCNKNS